MPNKFRIKRILQDLPWLLILLIPLISILQSSKWLTQVDKQTFYGQIISMILFYVLLFYLNLYLLIPRYLFAKKYLTYGLICAFCLLAAPAVPPLVLSIANQKMIDAELANPILRAVRPVAMANVMLLFILAFAFSTVLAINSRLTLVEQEKLKHQMQFLKNQVHPHFLFNVLNSIYSATIVKAPNAADMVDKLASMMRYTLKESETGYVNLKDELEYIESYIAFQRLRFGEELRVYYEVEGVTNNLIIAPMVLIPFIENAFKYGINHELHCYIGINIIIKNHNLMFIVKNNKLQRPNEFTEQSGIGIENTRSRLNLLYGGNYDLRIDENDQTFQVVLQIKLT